MTNPMTPERLNQIKARYEAATEGPWTIGYNNPSGCPVVSPNVVSCNTAVIASVRGLVTKPNTAFIAHARQDLPDCLAEIERLQKREIEWTKLLGSAKSDVERLSRHVDEL